ncbi:MAG: GGDEF domain-containing protein [Labilithrix sp.]|nr:GGDEF domain-containing protein [Labilithrix sp.]MBX3220190.1 GGDEF domain-containing protein [Labilithrix sp.]
MFWRKRQPEPVERSEEAPPPSADQAAELEAAVEGAAEILRARARYAFFVGDEDAATISATFERWASHLLVRSPPPGASREDAALPVTRDWRGLVHYVSGHARREQEWVHGSVREMREAIFAMVDALGRSSCARGQHDALLRNRLATLNGAVQSGSVDALKREALAVAATVTAIMEEQRLLADRQARELEARLHVLTEQLEQTRREGETDPLTKLANRRVFDVSLTRALAVASAVGRPLTLLMVDVDHFKQVNDEHGHPAGDKVLRAVADGLARAFPRCSDMVARYGGEEFAIVLTDAGAHEATSLAARCLDAVRALRIDVGLRVLAVTASVGVAVARPGESSAELVARADRALYNAKRGGRDRFVDASPVEDTSRAA